MTFLHRTFLLILFFFSLQVLSGDEISAADPPSGTPDALLEEIREAAGGSFYRKALNLIDRGEELYPSDLRFPMKKGDLYRDQELYSLALEAYRHAEVLDSRDRSLREKLAEVLGYLDRNYEALVYLESLVDEGEDLLDDLGWMYYKTHYPEKGILRLRKALEKEFDRHLSLTLGSLYAETNSVEECRSAYLDAIDDALDDGDSYFASVGYYNLSLAEKSFYDYEAAEEYARLSLDLMDRAGGHLALGELYTMRLDFDRAAREYGSAADLDKTPLSRLSLASLMRLQGRLDEALVLLNQVRDRKDESWMYYYGLNRDQFRMDLYRHYGVLYKGLYNRTRLFREWGLVERIGRLRDLLSYGGRSLYYRLLYRILAFREGTLQYSGGSELRGALTLAGGCEGYASLSGRYYRNALALEGFEEARPWYDLVLGREEKDSERLRRAAQGFMADWEKEPVEEALRENWFLLSRREKVASSDTLYKLYSMNPGSLIQYGLRLPVSLELSRENPGLERRLKRALVKSGFSVRDGASLLLRFQGGGSPSYTLSDRAGRVIGSGTVEGVDQDSLRLWVTGLRSTLFLY